MALSVGSQNMDTKISKIPVPQTTVTNTAGKSSASQQSRPSLTTRKSAEELKLRLASAVSAKLADGKEGRNPGNNRGIGYLLQRKEHQDKKLNVKDISLQNPAGRPSNDKAKIGREGQGLSTNGVRNGMSKAELHKSLLTALMNNRKSSGGSSEQNRSASLRGGDLKLSDARSPSESSKITTASAKYDKREEHSSSKNIPSTLQPHKGSDTLIARSTTDKTASLLGRNVKKELKEEASRPGEKNGSSASNGNNSVEKTSKKPPPVAKKPSKEEIQTRLTARSGSQAVADEKMDKRDLPRPREKSFSTNTNVANARMRGGLREDVLEKLEADVGRCKIAAFQTMEDFSALRMRVYRIRNDLDQLRKERGRPSLVC